MFTLLVKAKAVPTLLLLETRKELLLSFDFMLWANSFQPLSCFPEILHHSLRLVSHFERNKCEKHGETRLPLWRFVFHTRCWVDCLKRHIFSWLHVSQELEFLCRTPRGQTRRVSYAQVTLCCYWEVLWRQAFVGVDRHCPQPHWPGGPASCLKEEGSSICLSLRLCDPKNLPSRWHREARSFWGLECEIRTRSCGSWARHFKKHILFNSYTDVLYMGG